MAPAGFAEHAAPGGAQDEALLNEEGFDHVFEGVAGFGQRGCQRFDSDGAAVVVFGDSAKVAAVHGVEPDVIDLEAGEGRVGDGAVDGVVAGNAGEVADPAQQPAGDARRTAGSPGDLDGTFVRQAEAQLLGAAGNDPAEFLGSIEHQAEGDSEAVAQGRGEKTGAGGCSDKGKGGEVDADGPGCRALADDEVELEVLHRRIQDFFYRWLQAVDLVDEQDVAGLEVGEDGGKVAGALDDGAGGGAKADAKLAGDDLGERGFAKARGAVEENVVKRVAAGTGGLDEDAEVFPRRALADELVEGLGAEGGLGGVFVRSGGGDGAVFGHGFWAGWVCALGWTLTQFSPNGRGLFRRLTCSAPGGTLG